LLPILLCSFYSTLAYAKWGIADYWVLDVIDRKLYVLQEPSQEGYQSEVIFSEVASVSPLQFSELEIALQDMLPEPDCSVGGVFSRPRAKVDF
jgi:Uma2 family endonuclease